MLPALGGLLALYLAAPLAAGLAALAGARWRGADWHGLIDATGISAASATATTALVAIGGVPLGYLLARRRGVVWRLLGTVVQLPLALPPLGSGILLLLLLGPHSTLTDTLAGVILAQTFVAAPFGIIAARSAFAAVDPTLEDVASTLGHGPASVFRRVSLRLGARPIAAGLLLAWLRAFGEFGATVLVAYHPYTLPVFTYIQFGAGGLPSMLLVLVPTLLVAGAATAATAFLLREDHGPSLPPGDAAAPSECGRATPPPCRPRPASETLDLLASVTVGRFELDFSWHPTSRRLAILGASGSGKSLTLRLLAGLEDGRNSTVRFGRLDLAALPPERRPIGWVPQDYALFPGLDVARQIRFAADADEAAARHWTARFALAPLAARTPDRLSGGERQRVALARAMSRAATRLLLLDEPFSALDAPLRLRLRAETSRFVDAIDATVILVTHDPDEALALADEILLLDRGRRLQAGSSASLHRRPVSAAAARLLGATGDGRGTIDADGRLRIGGGVTFDAGPDDLPPPGAACGWSVRADQIRLGADGHPATIVWRDREPRGGRHALRVRVGDEVLEVAADPGAVPDGDETTIRIDPAAIQLWPLEDATG